MKALTLISLTIALALLTTLAVAASAPQPTTLNNGGCIVGGGYDPACDVDHDGDIDTIDIQLTAGHWNETGTWVGDNDHDHLGQTWQGIDNPLVIGGTFSGPDHDAPLVLSNSGSPGSGLRVTSSAYDGVTIESADAYGMRVVSADWDGVYVNTASGNGLTVGTAGGLGRR